MVRVQKLQLNQIAETYTGYAKNLLETKKLLYASPQFYQEVSMRDIPAQIHQDITVDCRTENVPLHNHSFYEVLYCREGEATYLFNDQRYRIGKGDLVVIPPTVGHQPLFFDDLYAPYDRMILWAKADLPATLKLEGLQSSDVIVLRCEYGSTEEIAALFSLGCLEGTEKTAGWEASVLGLSIQILVRISRLVIQHGNERKDAVGAELLERIVAYIDRKLAQKITLTDTAKEFLISESTISKLFRASLHESFYRFVTHRRILKAKSLLGENVPLQEIYSQVGYADYSAFYRAFRQDVGVAPNQYRGLFFC